MKLFYPCVKAMGGQGAFSRGDRESSGSKKRRKQQMEFGSDSLRLGSQISYFARTE